MSVHTSPRIVVAHSLKFGEDFFTRRSVFFCSLLAAVVGVTKAGFSGVDSIVWSPETWPMPDGQYPQLSYGIRTIGFFLGIDTPQAFTNLGFALILITLVVISLLMTRAFKSDRPSGKLVVLITLSGPLTWILAGRIGHPDTFVLLGSAALGLFGHRVVVGILGGLLLVLGSPEQAVLISLSLLILTLAPSLSPLRKGAVAALATSSISWISLTTWSQTLQRDTRSSIYLELLPLAFERFFVQFPVIAYAGYGLTVLFVLAALLSESWRGGIAILLGAIAVPLLATATTGDQGRVLVCMSTTSIIALGLRFGGSLRTWLEARLRYPFMTLFAIVLFLPAIDVTGNIIRTPWSLYYPYIQAYLINQL